MERNIIATEALDARRQGISYAIEDVQKDRESDVGRIMGAALMNVG